MFLKLLKNFFLKRKLKARLAKVRPGASMARVNKIGVLVDESYFDSVYELLQEIKMSLPASDISVIAYRDRVKAGDSASYPLFDLKAIDHSGEFISTEIKAFITQDFDMLISYYDVEKPILMLATDFTAAQFKVGFSTIDKRLNHFTIASETDKHKVFIAELVRYLKILNKV